MVFNSKKYYPKKADQNWIDKRCDWWLVKTKERQAYIEIEFDWHKWLFCGLNVEDIRV